MAYILRLSRDARDSLNLLSVEVLRVWDVYTNELIADPLPRQGNGFSIVAARNEFSGDQFLALVVDELPFIAQYDVYPWPRGEDNPLAYEGLVNVFRLVWL